MSWVIIGDLPKLEGKIMNIVAVVNKAGDVIGYANASETVDREIKIAGAFTINGSPVNVKTYKISRSVRNVEKAKYTQPVSKIGDVFTFHAVSNGKVVY